MKRENIKDIIDNLPFRLRGEWIKRNSSYENGLCSEVMWKVSMNRYFDAKFNKHKIEIKKGKSIWLDLVRYSEIVAGIGEKDTITTFFIPSKDKDKITDIFFVDTDKIIETLNITPSIASYLLELGNLIPRQLNAQASLTINDIKRISFYHHKFK
ncbi:hypothetical protein CAPN001_24340 [Capnocytophaga stomatis]|uniref:hypothetical protein n=1 Tax=Capnocytophaga stomatis TaxID=1848904 RepID=UPI00194DCF6E|nr:hypothetical protein [Capnocytophaga stomatis]GIJ97865.1 hypothetical protein CAPN001_24340 [Capnocytophaga stomatis]